jgi:hypothetical protein
MNWELLLAGPARIALRRIPVADRRHILAALDAMEHDPFSGDIVRLEPVGRRILVHDIVRRTSTTY